METLYPDEIETQAEPEIKLAGFFDTREKRFWFGPAWVRSNPLYQRKMADQCVLQLIEEGVDRYSRVSTEHLRAYKKVLHRGQVRHRSIPQLEGVTIILSKLGSKQLPGELTARTDVVHAWIKNMPPDRRIGGNNDFGGAHAGFSFPPKDPGRHIKLDHYIDDELVIHTLDGDKRRWAKREDGDIVVLDMENEANAREYVKSRFVSARARSRQ